MARAARMWQKGFTLVELAVVTFLLVVLASVLLWAVGNAMRRSVHQVAEIYAWTVLRTVSASYLAMGGDLAAVSASWGSDCGSRRVVRVGDESFVIAPPARGVASCSITYSSPPPAIAVRVVLPSGETLEVRDAL